LPVRLPTGRWMWIADVSELRVIYEIFVDRIYDTPELPIGAEVILDLGANAGVASEFFADRYPTSRIFAYEADPEVAARATRNLMRRENVTVYTAAISDRYHTLTLHRRRGESWATSVFGVGDEEFTVPAIPLDEVIADTHVDILKIDIEGSEYAAFKACRKLSRVDLILGEFHPIEDIDAEDFFGLLDGFQLLSGGGEERATFVARRLRPSYWEPVRVLQLSRDRAARRLE
jgi:FkbM family methyltransferase